MLNASMDERRNRAYCFGLSTALTAFALLGGLGYLFALFFREQAYRMPLELASFICTCGYISLLAPIFSLIYYAHERKRQYLIEAVISVTVFTFIIISAILANE